MSSFSDTTFNVRLAAELLNVSRTSLYNLEKEKIISPRKIRQGASSRKEFSWSDIAAISEHLNRKNKPTKQKQIQVWANLKGGVGKSLLSTMYAMTSSIHKKTLFVDLDPQGHSSLTFDAYDEESPTILDCISGEKLDLSEVVKKLTPNLHLVPANLSLSAADFVLQSDLKRAERLKPLLTDALKDYEQIVVDTNPSASILNVNGLLAATDILVVTATDFLSVAGLHQFFSILDELKEDFKINPNLKVVPNQFDLREKISQEALGSLRKDYPQLLTDTVVRKNADLKEAQKHGIPIWSWKNRSPGAEDIKALTKELDG